MPMHSEHGGGVILLDARALYVSLSGMFARCHCTSIRLTPECYSLILDQRGKKDR